MANQLIKPTSKVLQGGSRTTSRYLATVCQSKRHYSHQSRSQHTLAPSITHTTSTSTQTQPDNASSSSPLAVLPAYHLLRALMITTITTQPTLSQRLCKFLVKHSKILSENPITNLAIRKTFYDHFCAGNTKSEIQQTSQLLKSWGYDGISLAYAKEVESTDNTTETPAQSEHQIQLWKEGTLKTIHYTNENEFVAVKYTGAGSLIVQLFEQNAPLPNSYLSALDDICHLARSRNVGIMFDAEQTRVQAPMDTLTMTLMAKHNTSGKLPIVYNTYQTYLKSTTQTLAKHLARAKKEGFVFAAKIVRGAYLHSDPRHLIHDTKEDTDNAYNAAVETLLTQDVPVGVVVATHNRDSVDHAHEVLTRRGAAFKGEIAFAQLMGMADELSLELVRRNKLVDVAAENEGRVGGVKEGGVEETTTTRRRVNVIKYLPWGSVEECVKYLLRRADENQDALARTVDSKRAVWKEIWRRAGGAA